MPETCWDNKTAYFVASGLFFTFHYVYDARSYEQMYKEGYAVRICSSFLFKYVEYIKLNDMTCLNFEIFRHSLDRLSLPWIIFILNRDSAIN
jgi:hypothetical protein